MRIYHPKYEGRADLAGRPPRCPAFEVFVVLARAETPLTVVQIGTRLRERHVALGKEAVVQSLAILQRHRLVLNLNRSTRWFLPEAVRTRLQGRWPD